MAAQRSFVPLLYLFCGCEFIALSLLLLNFDVPCDLRRKRQYLWQWDQAALSRRILQCYQLVVDRLLERMHSTATPSTPLPEKEAVYAVVIKLADFLRGKPGSDARAVLDRVAAAMGAKDFAAAKRYEGPQG